MSRLLLPLTLSLLGVAGLVFCLVVWLGLLPLPSGDLAVAFTALAIALVLAVWFWSRLLWLEFVRLKIYAEAFGAGNYAVRLPDCQYSPLTPVMQAFNDMAERTQRGINAQRELTAAISHELRTPVARMRFALDMLASSRNDADRQRHISSMNSDMDELGHLLSELLVYARLEQSRMPAIQWQSVRIQPWFEQCLARLLVLVQSKTLVWSCDTLAADECAHFDPALMRRLLDNLVQNASRYANSRIAVTFAKNVTHYLLQVDDDGGGIPPEERERLFEPFAVMEASRNKENAGVGLGLAIVKRIVEAHAGSAVIETSPLGGARFTVSWAILPPP